MPAYFISREKLSAEKLKEVARRFDCEVTMDGENGRWMYCIERDVMSDAERNYMDRLGLRRRERL